MTVLIGLHVAGRIYLASDTRATCNGHMFPGHARKIGHGTDGRAIGVSGPQALGQAMIAAFFEEGGPKRAGEFGAFSRSVVAEYLKTVSNAEGCSGLVTLGGYLYDFDSTGAILQISMDVLHARGSGSDYAMGAGHALRKSDPEKRVRAAFDAACAFEVHCGGNLDLRKVSGAVQ
jgi:ATP-dependent protease HslVU (ClpYQ) peptidase subunit